MSKKMILLLFVSVLLCSSNLIYAGNMNIKTYVDNSNNLHIMWKGTNNLHNVSTEIKIKGPQDITKTTKDNSVRFNSLLPGDYIGYVIQNESKTKFEVEIEANDDQYYVLNNDSLNSLNIVPPVNDNSYPNLSIKFKAFDKDNNPILNLNKNEFDVLENSKNIENFEFSAPSKKITRMADIVVVFDDTGSMSNEIGYLKNNIQNFVEKLENRGVDSRYHLITYKDRPNDSWSWVEDADKFQRQIGSLSAYGGGDWTEEGFATLDIASNYSYRNGAQKIFLFFTDARSWDGNNPHYGKSTPTQDEIVNTLRNKGITTYAIAYNNNQYRGEGSITTETGGKWYPISTDFTDVVSEIGSEVGATYQIAYETKSTKDSELNICLQHSKGISECITYTRNLAPNINIYNPDEPTVGYDCKIGVHANDPENDELEKAQLKYRISGESTSWKSINPDSEVNNNITFNFTIPGEDLTRKGIEYYIWVSDNKGNKRTSEHKFISPNREPIKVNFEFQKMKTDETNMVLKADIINLEAEPSFSYKGSSEGVFSGTPWKKITHGSASGSAYFEELSSGKFNIVLPYKELKKDNIAFVKLRLNLSDRNDKESKVFCYPIMVNKFIKKHANTVVLTDSKKLINYFPNLDGHKKLKENLTDLIDKTWQVVKTGNPYVPSIAKDKKFNMLPIVVSLNDSDVIESSKEFRKPYVYDGSNIAKKNANVLNKQLKQFLKNKNFQKFNPSNFDKGMYLLLIGGGEIIPYGQTKDGIEKHKRHLPKDKQWKSESDWFNKNLNPDNKEISKTLQNLYVKENSMEHFPSDAIYRDYFNTGRLVETPNQIAEQLKLFKEKKGYILTKKRALYFGGYDFKADNSSIPNSKEFTGFNATRKLKRYFNNKSNWNTKGAIHEQVNLSGDDIQNNINSADTGLIQLEGHGNYNKLSNTQNGAKEKFYAGVENFEKSGNAWELSNLENFAIMSGMSCHLGVNYSYKNTDYSKNKYTDFPEAFAHNNLPIYIANTAFGAYVTGGYGGNAEWVTETMRVLTKSSPSKNIYKAFFLNVPTFFSNNTLLNDDIKSRPQFYGIPNYRRGPNPSKTIKSFSVAENKNISTKSLVQENNSITYLNIKKSNYNKGTTIDINFDISGNYNFSKNSGKLSVNGIRDTDQYKRPAITYSFIFPQNSNLTKEIVGSQTEIREYNKLILPDLCNSKSCVPIELNTEEFKDNKRIVIHKEGNKVNVRIFPIQYNTNSKLARITKKLQLKLKIDTPVYISDSDNDGLPDYWEKEYGLNIHDPNGPNGPEGDPDEDGRSNIQEYSEKTNPVVKQSIENDRTPPRAPTIENIQTTDEDCEIEFNTSGDCAMVQAFYKEKKHLLPTQSAKVDSSKNIYLTMLKPDTQYNVVLRSYDVAGNISKASETVTFTTNPEDIPGDLNGDGDIDADDYSVFRSTLGKCSGDDGFIKEADYDEDGCITYADYRTWYGYYKNQ